MKKLLSLLITLIIVVKCTYAQSHEYRFLIKTATYQRGDERVVIVPDSLVLDKLVIINFVGRRIQIFERRIRYFTIVDVAPKMKTDTSQTDVLKCIDESNNGCRIYLTRYFKDDGSITLGVQYSDITYIYFLKDF